MTLIRSALFRIGWPCYVETTDEGKKCDCVVGIESLMRVKL